MLPAKQAVRTRRVWEAASASCAIRELERIWEQEGLPSKLRKAQIDALRSQLSELQEELKNMKQHQESDSGKENERN